MSDTKYLTYRGEVRSAVAVGSQLYFVTAHPEQRPTALYQLDIASLLETRGQATGLITPAPLPCGAVALAGDAREIWLAGTDRQLYRTEPQKLQVQRASKPYSAAIVQLVLLDAEKLAVLAGAEISIIARKNGKLLQKLELPEIATCAAVDPTGRWLAAGTNRGTVAIFECEDRPQFVAGDAQRLHEGAVTALLFEREELRFFSAGADRKLLSTFARGKLDSEDKGRTNSHTEPITAMCWSPGDRFFTASFDKTIKSWPRSGHVKPNTYKDGIGKVKSLVSVRIGERGHLMSVCEDNSLRVFPIDEEGRLGDATVRLEDAYALARHELTQDVPRREAALKSLAAYDDAAAIEIINQQINADADAGLRLLSAQLLANSRHPRVPKLLEQTLKHTDEAVRLSVLEGLRRHLGATDLRPLDLALRTEQTDIGKQAVTALQALARNDDQAVARLTQTLNAKNADIRNAALIALENVHAADSPEADLVALSSQHADLRRLALMRLYQRKVVDQDRVHTALRARLEDQDGDVRRIAFLLTVSARPKLAQALRERDDQLRRQMDELDGTRKAVTTTEPDKADIASLAAKNLDAPIALQSADYEPLLQATASRALDTCLRGARGLAVLRDVRAFGLLLQVSREADAAARVQVCYAMAALEDERGINRLRSLLYDGEAPVRDAAFSALAHIHRDAPLLAAEAGLNSTFEDVRRRGLHVLTEQIRKQPPMAVNEPAWGLLLRALNDGHASVRSEATKAVLNAKVAGGGIKTLRFLLQSLHADVRLEVLTEVMAQINEDWARNLLLEFYNDADAALRDEAFQFAVQKTKALEPLERALLAQYADVRTRAVQALAAKHTNEAVQLLITALADRERSIRQLALAALVGEGARSALEAALISPNPDVQVRAAAALAREGQQIALATLLRFATAAEPEQADRKKEWLELAELAVAGLAELGDARAMSELLPLLQSKHAALRKAAAQALVWCSRSDATEALQHALQHDDPQVKFHSALGLAFAGNPLAASLVFSAAAAQHLSAEERLAAALALGPAGADQLVVFLDDDNEGIRRQALLLIMLLELQDRQPTPLRVLTALSSRTPRLRLIAAEALEHFAAPDAFRNFVIELINDRGDELAWTIGADVVDALSAAVAYGDSHTRARTVLLFRHLLAKEQAAWNQAWSVHGQRFAAQMQNARRAAGERQSGPAAPATEHLREVAFGAYVGLVREQGSAPTTDNQIVRIRQAALARLLALARSAPHYRDAAVPVFIQALADPNQAVRMQAFEQLQQLAIDRTALGAEALEAGHLDLGVKGLELLSAGAVSAKGQAALEQVMRTRTDALAIEAAKLLVAQRNKVEVARQALEAGFEDLRKQALAWLVEEYDADEAAREGLRQALKSRFSRQRHQAALELAAKKDTAAFSALVELLQGQDNPKQQKRTIETLEKLGDPRTPAALLDRLENDPAGTALADDLLTAAGNFRRAETAERLLAMAEKNAQWRRAALHATLVISGYDQPIADPNDEQIDRQWLNEQHPRHDDVLARLMDTCFSLGETALFNQLVPAARWAQGSQVQAVLTLLLNHPNDGLRNAAVEALGFRLRKRKGAVDPLLKALQHRNPMTQFLAAEGLARAGHANGLSVLLASIDFQSDFTLRQRAVMALGELGDTRSLDVLLKLANEDGHVLQGVAAEALGHLSKSNQADEVFKLLERLASGSPQYAPFALRGLRWFNSPEAWQVIRKHAQAQGGGMEIVAVDLLGYNDEPATRDLLLRLLRQGNQSHYAFQWQVINAALNSARRLWGADAVAPDLAFLENPAAEFTPLFDDCLKRVGKKASSTDLFRIFTSCTEFAQEAVAAILLTRTPPPLAEARDALASNQPRAAQLAAHILGRAGKEMAKCEKDLARVLQRWRNEWRQQRLEMLRRNQTDSAPLNRISDCLRTLMWAAGKIGVAEESLVESARAYLDDNLYQPIRLQAVTALGRLTNLSEKAVQALRDIASGNDPESRIAAADILTRAAPQTAAQLAEALLTDRLSFNRLAAHDNLALQPTLQKAAGIVHYQGVVLPELVRRGDDDALFAVVQNRALPETTRLGAIEGLAAIAADGARDRLEALGNDATESEDIRKAAWRGLRRARRQQRAKQTA